MDPRLHDIMLKETRRQFFGRCGRGLGIAALATLFETGRANGAVVAPRWTGALDPLHFAPRAKRVIWLYQSGGPSHIETLDYKPTLAKYDGQPMPESITKGQPIAQLQGAELKALGPRFNFSASGKSGLMISDALRHTQGIADDICIIRSMQTEQINHDPAHTFMNTGTGISGRPSMGSWVTYGIGSETENLPGFVVLTSIGGGQNQPIAARQWHSGFLPSRFQGVAFQPKGDPVLYVGDPPGVSSALQRDLVDTVRELDTLRDGMVDDPEIATRISQYEMAFRMQTSVPELTDIASEPAHIKAMYGVDRLDGSFAANVLLARRMLERGVRFIQCYHRDWDHHGGVKGGVEATAKITDQASAALVKDLKQRGMLEDTLVIWGGEFGRTPMAQGDGRDHHIRGFSLWMAGGGIKGGISHGETDEFGYHAAVDKVHVHDFHATVLHMLGIDHTKLTYRFQGRDFRLTDVAGEIVTPVFA